MKRPLAAAALAWIGISAPLLARADDVIDFDGVAIDGQTSGPAGIHVQARPARSFDPLIIERSSFREEMARELRGVDEDESAVAAPVRLAQAGTVNPCHDELYLSLKKQDLQSLSDREFEILKAKDQACNEARVRTVATPAPAPTPIEPLTPPPADIRPAATPAPTPAPAPAPLLTRAQPWGAKDLLLLMFGGVALLLLMMGGMLLLVLVLAG